MTFKRAAKSICFLGMIGVFAAVLAMSLTSRLGTHPDEICHVGAGKYYIQYWDLPKVGDARTLGAYSNYGVSYLHELDVVYFLAGKFARLILPLAGRDYLALRLFNVTLLGLLMVLFWRLPDKSKLAFLPLFVTPQIWYIFSYFNGDALPLFATFLVVYLVARTEGLRPAPAEDHCLPGGGQGRGPWFFLGFGAALGLVAVSKENYYVFLVYFLGFAGLVGWFGRSGTGYWRWIFGAVLVAGLIFGVRYGLNASLESGQPPDVVAKQAEKMAAPEFKPSKQAVGQGFWGLNMRAQGISFTQMFTGEWKWHVFTFRSAVGEYGTMDIEAPLIYYRHIGWLLAAFGLAVCWLLARSGREGWAQLSLWLLFSGLTVFQSVWHSWIADFQAQGRYLFPMLAMTGCALGRFAGKSPRTEAVLWAFGAWLWGMSLWSYLFVGLANLQG